MRFLLLKRVGPCALVVAALVTLPAPFQAEPVAPPGPPVIFILDASGSMAEAFGESNRLDAARALIAAEMARLPARTALGLVAYGNRIPGCRSMRLYSRVQTGNRETIDAQLALMRAEGATPLAGTLKLVRETLLPLHPDAQIVVISDGAESCGGNPARVAEAIVAGGAKIRVNVIGIDLNADATREMEAVARAGKGLFLPARDQAAFARALARILRGTDEEPRTPGEPHPPHGDYDTPEHDSP